MKKYLLTALIALTPLYASAYNIIDISDDINSELTRLEIEQENYKTLNGKYQHKEEIINNIKFTTHEYITSKGEKGYQVYIERLDTKQKMSYGIGVLSNSKNFDWTEEIIATSTPKI